MTENAFGIDISAYQYGEGKPVDFERMKAQDPRPAHGPVQADPAWTQACGGEVLRGAGGDFVGVQRQVVRKVVE